MLKPREIPATSKLYRYGFLRTFWVAFLGWFLFALCVLMFFGIPAIFADAWLRTGVINLPTSELSGFAFLWILSAPAALGMLEVAHLFSPILVSDKYLAVRFCLRQFRIPWEDILELRGMGLFRTRGVLIRVSKSSLPWIYALYGAAFWQLGGRYIPVSSSIENYQNLVEEIRRRSPHPEHH
jgi:hypothetical protein